MAGRLVPLTVMVSQEAQHQEDRDSLFCQLCGGMR